MKGMIHKQDWPLWRIGFTVLNVLGLSLSMMLSWHYFSGTDVAGCGGGSPCEEVLSSRWSSLWGILPVSGLAVGTYLAMFIASLWVGRTGDTSIRRLAWGTLLLLSGAVMGSAWWFIVLQKWILERFCFYCMTAHITGLLISLLILVRAFNSYDDPADSAGVSAKDSSRVRLLRPLQIIGWVLLGLMLPAGMAALQVWSSPAKEVHGNVSQTTLTDDGDRNVPLSGSPEATYVVTLLFDYQCSHCQKIHWMLPEVIRQYEGRLAFVLRPAPLEPQCNPYVAEQTDAFKNSCELARLAMAVWRTHRDTFAAFEHWLFTFETGSQWRPRSLDAARAKAEEWLGRDALQAALSDPWIDQYIQGGVTIFGQTAQQGAGMVPQMIFGSVWMVPEPSDALQLGRMIHENLGVPRSGK